MTKLEQQTLRLVRKAMDRIRVEDREYYAPGRGRTYQTPWYADEFVSGIIDLGASHGWLHRASVTQVHWTDAGVAALDGVAA